MKSFTVLPLFCAVVMVTSPLREQLKNAVVEITNAFGVTKQLEPKAGVETGTDGLDYGACQRAVLFAQLMRRANTRLTE
jgi:hypothetical protein